MSDTTPLAILPAVTSSDPHVAGAIKSAIGGLNSQSKGDLEHNEGSFLEFLNAFNALSNVKNGTPDALSKDGNILPLAIETADPGHSNELQLHTLSSQLAETTEENLSTHVNSAALASRLVNLAKGDSPADETLLIPNPQALSATSSQTLTSTQSNSENDLLLPDSPLQITNRVHLAAAATVNKELMKSGTESVSKQGPATAVSISHELHASIQPTDLEMSETDTFFAAQVKKMIAEQQGAMNPEKQFTQNTLTSTTANTGSFDPVSASQVRLTSTQPILTTETISTASYQATISETFGRPEWNQGMGKQILWMANQNIRTAELRLNPAHLGPIEVRIEMDDDQVNLAFSSRHAVVREAVEQAIPRLREMFEESGLNLADTDVSQQSFAEQRSQESADYSEQHGGSFSNQPATSNTEEPIDSGKTHSVNIGLVDYYI